VKQGVDSGDKMKHINRKDQYSVLAVVVVIVFRSVLDTVGWVTGRESGLQKDLSRLSQYVLFRDKCWNLEGIRG